MRIFLQYPWRFPDSPYYKYLIESPPKNIKYLNVKGKKGASSSAKKFRITQKLKNLIKNTPQKLGITIVNVHKTKAKKNYDLIHCAHCLSKNKSPWVADLEMGGSLLISGFKNKGWQKRVKKYLYSPYCKKIMPWTNFVKERLLKDFPKINKKIEVVYPAIPHKKIKKKKSKKITFIYIARSFKMKGGLLALKTMRALKKKYPSVRCIIISDFPPEMKDRYFEIEIYPLMPHKEALKLMSESNIFIYPSLIDTFGFAILEAMSFGLPVIALKTPGTHSIEEIIENGKNGFLVESPNIFPKNNGRVIKKVLDALYKNCEKIMNDKKLREKMSKNCTNLIKNGKFSIKERNKKLKRIYEEALK
jgi:glycosyltransferase involved in cell wall biosynthesis